MSAGDEDADRLRIGPWIPEPVEVSGGRFTVPAARAVAPDARPAEPAQPEPAEPDEAGPVVAETSLDEPPSPAVPPEEPPPPPGPRHATEPGHRRWLLVAGVAAGLATAVAIPLAIGTAPPTGGGSASLPSDTSFAGAPVVAASVSPAAPSPSSSPAAPSPTVRASTRPAARPARTTATPRPAPFGPVGYEAEAAQNTTGGSAFVDTYPGASGGRIVRNIGDWGARSGPGWLRFNNVTVPADGTYQLTFYYVHLDNERQRTAVITVAGAAPITVAVIGSSTCCAASTVRISLRKGTNSITFGNPTGRAPSIDRIVLSTG